MLHCHQSLLDARYGIHMLLRYIYTIWLDKAGIKAIIKACRRQALEIYPGSA